MAGKTLGSLVAVVVLALVMTSGASSLSRPEVISLLDVTVTTVTDPPNAFQQNAPPTTGTRFFFTDALYTWAGSKRGKRVGRLEGNCTFTGQPDATTVTGFCHASAFLPAGQIVIAGSARFGERSDKFALAVTGGTGHYGNARGWASVRNIGQGDNSSLIFHLVP